ncbi:MAG TPA: zf-HC2 domain-containing protein [Bryobacteraceae bacterium]|jgi:anti-sigma factor RsiW|nr:zf-HC2 domain-containing protein [Bryobacteraceae bacterium]
MTLHENIRELLALSGAGLLEPAEERRVREHLRDCPECAAHAEEFASLSVGLSALPAPLVPWALAARTQARLVAELAAEADRRQGAILAVAGGLLAWVTILAAWYCYRTFAGGSVVGWLAWSAGLASVAAPAAAGLLKSRRRVERSMS